jgi:RDD family
LALLLLAVLLRGALVREGARRALAAGLSALLLCAAGYTAWDSWRGDNKTAPTTSPKRALAELAETASDTERVARLQAEVDRLRGQLEHRGLRDHVNEALDDIGLSFGWGIVYFSLLPAWWRGQTVGKWLFRLRVVELTGKPITPLRALKRYGGYAAGLATGGLGFVHMLWEPNRQALHDKAAHTVVIDERLARLPAPVDDQPPQLPPAG